MPKVLHKNNHWWVLCPGCKTNHRLDVRWKFNYDDDKPTFEPRLKSLTMQDGKNIFCFVRIVNGFFEYDSTCTHELAGHIVEMLDWKTAKWHEKNEVNTEGGDSDEQRHERLQGEQGR